MKIDTTDKAIQIWIVKELTADGDWGIRAICLDEKMANRYLAHIKEQIDTDFSSAIAARIEQTIANHLFGDSMYDSWYGKAPMQITPQERRKTIQHFQRDGD